jgi:hypothetical protein
MAMNAGSLPELARENQFDEYSRSHLLRRGVLAWADPDESNRRVDGLQIDLPRCIAAHRRVAGDSGAVPLATPRSRNLSSAVIAAAVAILMKRP